MGNRFKTGMVCVATALASLFAGLLSGAATTASDARPAGAAVRPNILVFMVDDLDALTTPYWDAMPKTRFLLRDQGRMFVNHFSAAPLSASSRAGILTGQYGHNNHVLTNKGPWGGYPAFVANGDGDRTFAKYLHDAGYRTMHAGKYVPGYEPFTDPIPSGWDEWYGTGGLEMYIGYGYRMNANGQQRTYGTAPSDYITDVLGRLSSDFVTRSTAQHPGQAWLMYVNTPAPHLPIEPALRHVNHPWKNAPVPKRPNYFEADVSDKGTWLQASLDNRETWRSYMDVDHQHRMGSLLAVDDMIATTLKSVADNGQLANTIVMFSSDQGYMLGAHRLFGKNVPYEESIQTPLVIRGPGVTPGTDKHLALQIDLMPTMLELAGVAVPNTVDGRSLVPLMRAQDPPDWRDSFIAEYKVDKQDFDPNDYRYVGTYWNFPNWRAVRTTRYMLVQWWDAADFVGWPAGVPGCCAPQFELYDLQADPYELNNLVATPAGQQQYAGLFSVLYRRMYELAACAGPTCNTPPSQPFAGSNPVVIPKGGTP
jgi:arylsulfatase A-like enzyme